MLNSITIDNFATIEHLSFDIGPSLNVITGETGAGKSVLVTAVSTVLGGRADTSIVRTGASKSVIQIAGDKSGEEVVISREILSSGKSVSRLNGQMVTLAQLREFCSDWVDIHGQYDNQKILDPESHILITDSYRGDTMAPELDQLSRLYEDYRAAQKEYDDLLRAESEAKRQRDYYEYEYNYIRKLNLIPREDDELRDQLEIMKNSSRIFNAVNVSREMIHGGSGGDDMSVLTELGQVCDELSSVAGYSDSLSSLSEDMSDIYYRLEDVSERLRDISSTLTFSEEDMDLASERLSVIEDAKRKYGRDIDGIIDYMNELSGKLELIANFDSEKSRLAEAAHRKYAALEAQADHVSELRHLIATRLESSVTSELRDLDFANSEFAIDIQRLPEIGPSGYDRVEFMISTNPGEPLMPLARIASGGEISRIMLAFKRIIADSDSVETMIFDEIDTGISGRTALTVGRKLREIAVRHQIICITHLPQIAACGADNYLITKDISTGRSLTAIEHLDDAGRAAMVASLFSGDAGSESAVDAARDLISRMQE